MTNTTTATTGSDTCVSPVYDTDCIRIRSHDANHWHVDWSYQGRDDLMGSGWLAQITAYTPGGKFRFQRQFIDRHIRLVRKSDKPIILEYRSLYAGQSKYAYDKRGGADGMLSISPNGKVSKITEAVAVTMLQQVQQSKTLTLNPAEIDYLRALLGKDEIGMSLAGRLA